MVHEGDRSFQGIYVGAGPYLAADAYAEFDSELVSLMNSEVDTYVPDGSFGIGGGETDQLALAMTGGYRARFPFFSQGGTGLLPAATACMSPRISTTCSVSASTTSKRPSSSTPTRW